MKHAENTILKGRTVHYQKDLRSWLSTPTPPFKTASDPCGLADLKGICQDDCQYLESSLSDLDYLGRKITYSLNNVKHLKILYFRF